MHNLALKSKKKMNSNTPVSSRFFKKYPKPEMIDFSIYACCYTVQCTVVIAQWLTTMEKECDDSN